MSSTSAGNKAKSSNIKKTIPTIDKPQSQINKCLNEKRRREQENVYIEELAELISASIQDMSSLSVKPDKCAILQETVNQIRRIKAAEELAVQQGEVSSSTNILANEILCPLVLEALDGFLFVVNSDGIVEFVSENVQTFVQFGQVDLLGKSIYNVIHLSDHARFSSSLLPMSIGWTSRSSGGSTSSSPAASASAGAVEETAAASNSSAKLTGSQQRSFNIRVLVKPSSSEASTVENTTYENMQITAMLMPHPVVPAVVNSVENLSENCLVCIARRLPPNERPPGTPVEQFTTKLGTDGNIIGVDTSGLSNKFSSILLKKDHLLHQNTLLQELCLPSDLQKLDSHLRETLQNGSSTSSLYKLKLSPEKYVQVQTKSKFFAFSNQSDSDFIMATHTIINPNNSTANSNPNSNPASNQSNQEEEEPIIQQQQQLSSSDYDFDFGSWAELEMENKHSPYVNSPVAGTSNNMGGIGNNNIGGITTNNNNNSKELALANSPLAPNLAGTWGIPSSPQQQQQQQQITNQHNSSAQSQSSSSSHGHQNSPLAAPAQQSQSHHVIGNNYYSGDDMEEILNPGTDRLRNLLTLNSSKQAENKILKGLLNQDDEDLKDNNMLLNLLNEKKPANNNGNELLQQLLGNGENENNSLKRSLSQMMSTDFIQSKQLVLAPPPAPGELCKRNPRLVSLLAKQPEAGGVIPQVPSNYISGTPQEKLLNQIKSGRAQVTLAQAQGSLAQAQGSMAQQVGGLAQGGLAQGGLAQGGLHQLNQVNAQMLLTLAQQQQGMTQQLTLAQAQQQNMAQQQQQLTLAQAQQQHQQQQQQNLLQAAQQQQQHQQQQSLLQSAHAQQQQQQQQPGLQQMLQSPSLSQEYRYRYNNPISIAPPPQQQQQQNNQQNQQQQNNSSELLNSDAILDEILDQVIDIVPENNSQLLSSLSNNSVYSDDVSNILNMLESNNQICNNGDPEMAKINAIQKELMQFESSSYQRQHPVPVYPQPPTPPVFIQRTTTTTTTSIQRYNNNNNNNNNSRAPPNQIAPPSTSNQQMLKQQLINQQKQRLLLLQQQQQQQQQNSQNNQQMQIIRELQLRSQNQTVGGQSLDTLLAGTPPNVTLQQQVVSGSSVLGQQPPPPSPTQSAVVAAPARVQLTPGQHNAIAHQQLLRQQQHQRWTNQQMLLKQQQIRQQANNSQQQNNPMLNAQLNLGGNSNPTQQAQQQIQPLIQQTVTSSSGQQRLFQQQNVTVPRQPQFIPDNFRPRPNSMMNAINHMQAQAQQQQQQQQAQAQQQQQQAQQQVQAQAQQQAQAQAQQQQVQQQGNVVPSTYDIRQEIRAIVGARVNQQTTAAVNSAAPTTTTNSVPDLEALGFHIHNPDSSNIMGD